MLFAVFIVVSTFAVGVLVLRNTTSIPKPPSDQAIWTEIKTTLAVLFEMTGYPFILDF